MNPNRTHCKAHNSQVRKRDKQIRAKHKNRKWLVFQFTNLFDRLCQLLNCRIIQLDGKPKTGGISNNDRKLERHDPELATVLPQLRPRNTVVTKLRKTAQSIRTVGPRLTRNNQTFNLEK